VPSFTQFHSVSWYRRNWEFLSVPSAEGTVTCSTPIVRIRCSSGMSDLARS